MIEINLLEKKKALKAPVILGVDLAKLPWRKIILALILAKFPVDFYREFTQSIEFEKEQELTLLKNQFNKIKKDIRKNKGIKEQLAAFNEQIKKLKSRSEQVDKIVKLKTNPRYLLERLARSTPKELWFSELILDGNGKILIKGGATNYTSIGEFIVRANESPIFGGTMLLKDSKTKELEIDGVKFREERFEIEGNIKLYDPY